MFSHPWWLDACRLRVGLLKRPQPQVPHLTRKDFGAELAELDRFAAWLVWFEAGKKGARPVVWAKVPDYAWKVEKEYSRAHPKPPPSPPSPPTKEVFSRWKNPPWRGVGLHVTWGFDSGQFSPQDLAAKIGGSKVEWAFLELNPANYNEAYADAFREALHREGKRFGVWEREDAQKEYPESRLEHASRVVSTYRPDFYGADIEEFPVDDPSFAEGFAKKFPDQPRLILVPGEPVASQLQPWFDNSWDMMTQSYAANIGQPPVPGIAGPCDHDTYWRGGPRNFIPSPQGWGSEWWQHGSGPHSAPIIEVNAEGNPGLRAQLDCDAVKWFGGNWSVWNAEELTDDDWACLAP